MTDSECVHFLQWCLPKLHLRWLGSRKVRRQICKRVSRRSQDAPHTSSPCIDSLCCRALVWTETRPRFNQQPC
jgi:hypothetical protein